MYRETLEGVCWGTLLDVSAQKLAEYVPARWRTCSDDLGYDGVTGVLPRHMLLTGVIKLLLLVNKTGKVLLLGGVFASIGEDVVLFAEASEEGVTEFGEDCIMEATSGPIQICDG